jgi:hypothetical protein
MKREKTMDGIDFRKSATALLLAVLLPAIGQAQADEDYVGYDTIIKDLNREISTPASGTSRLRQRMVSTSADPFDNVWIHGGIGFANTVQTVNPSDGEMLYLNHKGIQASLGIDLFSENWMAEGSARSFTDNENVTTRVALREFDLKIYFKEKTSRKFGYRVGTGLTARYMTIYRPLESAMTYTTPASVLTFGMDFFLTDRFSFGADLSARNSIIAETIDRTSYDATFRLDTHF